MRRELLGDRSEFALGNPPLVIGGDRDNPFAGEISSLSGAVPVVGDEH
ncbi:hypothetical protein TIFTF001_029916 [Ficus carica]|uniref:Uncharacterized protein n=1 Tax=Ficus carica TaxID=3494 RepID=A0AA88DSS9_FICCA|nr:hypothetical protein TIFTF001_029916 [Ficus carica]